VGVWEVFFFLRDGARRAGWITPVPAVVGSNDDRDASVQLVAAALLRAGGKI